MEIYSTSVATGHSPDKVIDTALQTLVHCGFEITERERDSAKLVGPGMNSTRQNALLGASRISLFVDNDQTLHLDARLGGVEKMQKFLTMFPFLLGLGLAAFFAIGGGLLFGQQFGIGFGVPWAPNWRWLIVATGGALLPVAPWLFLSPLMTRAIRRRTEQALETLAQDVCS